MGDARAFPSESKDNLVTIDPYALVQALLGGKVATPPQGGSDADYDDLVDMKSALSSGEQGPRPDNPPNDVRVGAVNPYALVEALLGRKMDTRSIHSAQIMSNVLQTDYDELFDMKHNSVLFAGLKLNEKDRKAEKLGEKDMKILTERDLITPDLSGIQKLDDLEKIGLNGIGDTRVKLARMSNGKLRLVLYAHSIGRTVSNRDVTMSVNELTVPFRQHKDQHQWTPPNGSWRDMYDDEFEHFERMKRRVITDMTELQISNKEHIFARHRFDDPIQGACSNSWFVAALFSVFWADPACINRNTQCRNRRRNEQDAEKRERELTVRFHDKGGHNNNRTETVKVNYEIPINNSNNDPMYCHASDLTDIWPSLYEKAFAKWITGNNADRPDITQTHSGDPVKAMAQINGREPHYFRCENHSPRDLLGLVRQNCVNFKTINPMTAWTHATGNQYRGSNLVANHAYSVLGYAIRGDRQCIVIRNPWGVTEPIGLTSYTGLLERLDPEFWQPAALLDQGGVFALEARHFKEMFSYMGVAK